MKKPTTNTKTYSRAMRITVVHCVNCNVSFQMQVGALVLDTQGAHQLADASHAQHVLKTKQLCANPEFVIEYMPVLVTPQTVTRLTATTIEAAKKIEREQFMQKVNNGKN